MITLKTNQQNRMIFFLIMLPFAIATVACRTAQSQNTASPSGEPKQEESQQSR